MADLAITTFWTAINLALAVQLFIYVVTPGCGYAQSWKRTGVFFMHVFALEPGPDRKLGTAALLLTAYIVGLPFILEFLIQLIRH